MIYECLVIDNECFWQMGKIKVRVSKGIGQMELLKEMSQDPQQTIEEYSGMKIVDPDTDETDIVETDTYAELSTCAGGFDAGIFMLPQPNTRGLVAEIPCAGSTPRYVWMGALMITDPASGPIADVINGPNDRIPEDPNEPKDDEMNLMNSFKQPNLDNPKDANHIFIFKQKETKISKDDDGNIDFEESKNSLDWKKARPYNLAVIDRARTFITHQIIDDEGTLQGIATISINNNDGVVISFKKSDDDTTYESKMVLDLEGNCSLENTNGKITNKFEATPNDLIIYHANDKFNAQLGMTQDNNDGEGRIDLVLKRNSSNVESSLSIHKKAGSNQDTIDITSSGDITLNPGTGCKLNLGGGTGVGYILTATHPGSISNFENETFTAVENVTI